MAELTHKAKSQRLKAKSCFSPTYICTQIPLPGTRFSNFIFASDNAPALAINNRVAQNRGLKTAFFSLPRVKASLANDSTQFRA